MKNIVNMFSNIKTYRNNFKSLTKKDKQKSIMTIAYIIFLSILLVFPILLVRELILYFMMIYELPNIDLVSLISSIGVALIYIITVLLYVPQSFNKKMKRYYSVN